MLFRPFLVTLFAVLLAAVANGQTTDATCLPYFGWTNGNFNVTAAKLSASKSLTSTPVKDAHDFLEDTTVESTAIPTQTSTSTSITTTTSSTSTEAPPPVVTDPSASTPASEASSNSSDNVIMGAIVGGTLGTAALIGFVYWLVSRRRLARSGIASTSPPESILGAPKSPADMQQYLANTVPTLHLAPSSAVGMLSTFAVL
ncbi:hypothetical protein H0H81_005667 [Sphagnurus paluster]|uniref:Uncharacterized protein n=1 Tax=Sphagnurus paluster TaxID=117069 RepID=A0A9P7K506_9AGAR|nr:hypothetical protein H0H81_005667 [Sphagnurus paluster]